MKRIEFRLSMPSCGSWNGKWSGAEKNYSKVVRMCDKFGEKVMGGLSEKRWWHRWSDGWAACVTATILEPGKRTKKSDGFCGYDWMIDNIIAHDSTLKPGETAA